MTSVAACEPELPPLLMISGTNSASTTARAISSSKKPIAVAVSISPTNSTASQPPRFRTMSAKPICRYGASSASHAADLLDVLGGLLLHHVHDVVGRDDALHPALGVDDGDGQEALLDEQMRHRFLVGLVRDGDEVGVHDVAHEPLGRRGEQLAERDHAQQPHVGREHVRVVDHFDPADRLASEIADGDLDRDLRPEPHVPRVHDAAGRILGVGHEGGHLAERGRIEQGQERRPIPGLHRLQHVGRVVRREQSHPGTAPLGAELLEQPGLVVRAEREEEVGRLVRAEQREPLETLLRAQDRVGVEQRFGGEGVGHGGGQGAASGRITSASAGWWWSAAAWRRGGRRCRG